MANYKCAWCRKDGAAHRVRQEDDGSAEHWRYFCGVQHEANWDTNQPRPTPIQVPMIAASIWEIIKQANLDNWYLVSMGQYGLREKITYRAVFQRRTITGASTETYTVFEDASDPRLAVLGAYHDAMKMMAMEVSGNRRPRTVEPTPVGGSALTAKQTARLEKALDANWIARKNRET